MVNVYSHYNVKMLINTVQQDMSIVGLERNMEEIQSRYDIDLQTIRMYGGEPLKK